MIAQGPKYRKGDTVTFMAAKSRKLSNEGWPGAPRFDQSFVEHYAEETAGIVMVVDVGGAIGIGEHSYDIMVAEENTLYKHVRESEIRGAAGASGKFASSDLGHLKALTDRHRAI